MMVNVIIYVDRIAALLYGQGTPHDHPLPPARRGPAVTRQDYRELLRATWQESDPDSYRRALRRHGCAEALDVAGLQKIEELLEAAEKESDPAAAAKLTLRAAADSVLLSGREPRGRGLVAMRARRMPGFAYERQMVHIENRATVFRLAGKLTSGEIATRDVLTPTWQRSAAEASSLGAAEWIEVQALLVMRVQEGKARYAMHRQVWPGGREVLTRVEYDEAWCEGMLGCLADFVWEVRALATTAEQDAALDMRARNVSRPSGRDIPTSVYSRRYDHEAAAEYARYVAAHPEEAAEGLATRERQDKLLRVTCGVEFENHYRYLIRERK